MSAAAKKTVWLIVGVGVLVILTPVLLGVATVSMLTGSAEACAQESIGAGEESAAAGGQAPAGLYARPLQLQPGRWYEVGATEYGGPADPTSSSYGSIPDRGQAYLPAHPDTYAELSVLRSNPANGGTFTFADANALDHLPYMTGLRVAHAGHQALLYKRDIGYGQGPGQTIANGAPYRVDVWWQAAQPLQITKSAVRIELAPVGGTAATLGELPAREEASGLGACEAIGAAADVPLPLVPGTRTRMLADGLAAAGRDAPEAVKRMVAAGNRLHRTAYLYGGGHGPSLDTLQSAYDCSSAVSYLLHAGGILGSSALDSSGLAAYGKPGSGQYVTIYANAAHAFIYIAGLRFDTVEDPAYDTGPNSGKPGPRWRVSPSVPDWSTWTVRHPAGL